MSADNQSVVSSRHPPCTTWLPKPSYVSSPQVAPLASAQIVNVLPRVQTGSAHGTNPRWQEPRKLHSLIHRPGTISRGSSLHAGPNQLFGAITMPPLVSAPSHAPHQLYALFAIIAWPHRRIR